REAGVVAATVTMQRWKDAFWGEVSGEAFYLHRLVVSRAFGGTGLGRKILEWAVALTREAGLPFLRLDCNANNPVLREKYYPANGFEFRGVVADGEWEIALFERRV
ncbi:MAG: GNAT family N-acetyltransferase, partial [Bdellovibrionota bacterium]